MKLEETKRIVDLRLQVKVGKVGKVPRVGTY